MNFSFTKQPQKNNEKIFPYKDKSICNFTQIWNVCLTKERRKIPLGIRTQRKFQNSNLKFKSFKENYPYEIPNFKILNMIMEFSVLESQNTKTLKMNEINLYWL